MVGLGGEPSVIRPSLPSMPPGVALLALALAGSVPPAAAGDSLSPLGPPHRSPPTAPPLLWPVPRRVTCSGPPRCLPPTLTLNSTSASAVVKAALARYAELLPTAASCPSGGSVVEAVEVKVGSDDERLGVNTSYAYTIRLDGSTVTIAAGTPFGALYGLETLSQLWSAEGQQQCGTALAVSDEPVYPHRGIMLDVGRRYHPLPVLKKVIDGMQYSKLNVLHFHAADFGGVRIESKSFPHLTAHLLDDQGAKLFYTHDDIAELIAYAKLRGVRVIPEIDLPGHSSGWFPLAATGDVVFCEKGGEAAVDELPTQLYDDPKGVTVKTLRAYLTELAGLFEDEVFHIGADETSVVGPCTLANTGGLEAKLQVRSRPITAGPLPTAARQTQRQPAIVVALGRCLALSQR